MIKKSFGKQCRVTFRYHPPIDTESISVLGDFNAWTPGRHKLIKRKDGTFSTTIPLPLGARFEYKFLLDGGRWHLDLDAEELIRNEWGEQNGVLHTHLPDPASY